MANFSLLHATDSHADIDGGSLPLSLGLSQPLTAPASCLAVPAATRPAATLNLSVPSLPQSHASDELATSAIGLAPSVPLQQHNDTTSAAEEQPRRETAEQPTQQPAGGLQEDEAREGPDDGKQEEVEEEEVEPAWETVHPYDIASFSADGRSGSGSGEGRELDISPSSAAVEDSLGAMALSLFDDGTQLPDDIDMCLHAPSAAFAAHRNLVNSLPAFPSLPSGLRTPPPAIPGTPSPPSERRSPASSSSTVTAAVAAPLVVSPTHAIPSTIAPSPPPSPRPALPATEPVSSSCSSSAASSISSQPQPTSPPTELARRSSTYSQETNPVLSLHSSSSSSSSASPSLPAAPPHYSQHPSMPALEQATGDQADIDVDELLHDAEQPNTDSERDKDGFVRPAVPIRQVTQERRSGSQRASQPLNSPPRSPLRSSLRSQLRSPPRPAQQSPRSPSLTSPSRATIAANPLTTTQHIQSTTSPQRVATQSLVSQLQSQLESQAWDLSYHYPELDATAREQLIADRGLTALYGRTTADDAGGVEGRASEALEEEKQSQASEEAKVDAAEQPAPQAQLEQPHSIEFDVDIDIDIELSDHDDDSALEQPAEQPTGQSASSHPTVNSTFCSQDTEDIPQISIPAQNSFASPDFNSPPPLQQPAPSEPTAAALSPVFDLSMSPTHSPLSPPVVTGPRIDAVSTAHVAHVARRTRSRTVRLPPQLPTAPVQLHQTPPPNHHDDTQQQEDVGANEQNGSRAGPLERQLSIDPEHPSSHTVLLQRRLMRDIRKQQREQEQHAGSSAAASTPAAPLTPRRMGAQLSRDRKEQRQQRTPPRRQLQVEEKEEQAEREGDRQEDDDFVPQRMSEAPYSATRERRKRAEPGHERMNGQSDTAQSTARAKQLQQPTLKSSKKRKVVAADSNTNEGAEDDIEEGSDKENEPLQDRQWKRLRKPQRGDSSRRQPVAASDKKAKAKASERAGALRQSSLLEHYASNSTATPPAAADGLMDFTPDTASASLPHPALSTPTVARRRASGNPSVHSPITAPPLFAPRARTPSTVAPARASASISVASRRGLVDITNTANSRQRPPSSPSKQPSNGWRTKRRKGDDGSEWEESPPSNKHARGAGEAAGRTRSGLKRAAATVGSLRRQGSARAEVVVLDATQEPDG